MRAFLVLALLGLAIPAQAQTQQLIPSPYGSGINGAGITVAPRPHRHQYLVPSPYSAGEGANIIVAPRARRHQYLVPSPYSSMEGANIIVAPRARRHQYLVPSPYEGSYRRSTVGSSPPYDMRRIKKPLKPRWRR